MVDYYPALLHAVTAPGAGDEDWRRGVYDRARHMLTSRLRTRQPPASAAEIAAEQSALEAAIERVESELSWTEHGVIAPDARTEDRFGDIAGERWSEPDRGPLRAPPRFGRGAFIALAVIAAALGAGGYSAWIEMKQNAPAIADHASSPQTAQAAAKNGDLPPGVDGGASDPDLPYVFRRQPTFYRTLQPVGTVIVDKLQHFLYFIEPNNVALRYGIAVGAQCADLAGLRHIASMTQWPAWQPPPEMFNRNPVALPGGPGNPLGARLLALDDGSSRIHGTNAPKTIGNVVASGCIRLDNDDVVDLYGRVQVATPVVVN
jgi:lipoprotein-anchoring transpeptidase ErfK/SrfK